MSPENPPPPEDDQDAGDEMAAHVNLGQQEASQAQDVADDAIVPRSARTKTAVRRT